MLVGMRDIEPMGGYGVLVEDDVVRATNGLIRGAFYTVTDLYARYSDVAREANRLPGHPVALGQVLSRWGCQRTRRRVGGSGKGRGGAPGKQVCGWLMN